MELSDLLFHRRLKICKIINNFLTFGPVWRFVLRRSCLPPLRCSATVVAEAGRLGLWFTHLGFEFIGAPPPPRLRGRLVWKRSVDASMGPPDAGEQESGVLGW